MFRRVESHRSAMAAALLYSSSSRARLCKKEGEFRGRSDGWVSGEENTCNRLPGGVAREWN